MRRLLKLYGLAIGTGALGIIYINTETRKIQQPSGPPYKILPKTPYKDHPNKHFLTREPKTIGIIGSGVSGLCTAKELKVQGFNVEVLERNQGLGGIWLQNYANVGIQGVSAHYEFPDFSFPDGTELFPKLPAIRSWLQSYSDHFGVTPLIRFNSEVTDIQQTSEDSWEVKLSTGETKQYDFLIMCTGLFNNPKIPEFPNSQAFKGQIIHSSKVFDNKELFTNKKVVIVGGSRSAIDMAKNTRGVASSATMVFQKMRYYTGLEEMRGKYPLIILLLNKISSLFYLPYDNNSTYFWYYLFRPFKFIHTWMVIAPANNVPQEIRFEDEEFPFHINVIDDLFVSGVNNGEINIEKGEISAYTEKGVIVNGKEIEADIVVMATGFNWKIKGENDHWRYRNAINPSRKNLAIIGTTMTAYAVCYYNIQAIWLCDVLKGAVKLPSVEEMKSEIEKRKERLASISKSNGNGWFFTQDLIDQLLRDMNISTVRKTKIKEEWVNGMEPTDYRAVLTHRI